MALTDYRDVAALFFDPNEWDGTELEETVERDLHYHDTYGKMTQTDDVTLVRYSRWLSRKQVRWMQNLAGVNCNASLSGSFDLAGCRYEFDLDVARNGAGLMKVRTVKQVHTSYVRFSGAWALAYMDYVAGIPNDDIIL